ncbi:ChaN family lipoprotein [Vibrio rumoiensis]|uniref:ChaN family lipoprotein n=1 Tax=Vibrio rumoiensis TaxID=76258 RepID=UPI000B5C847B|nr:ChaN family lipoprotein [Vibrio rumoiensis]
MSFKSFNKPLIILLTTVLFTAGCSSKPDTPNTQDDIITFFDYQLYTPRGQKIQLSQWIKNTSQADVILIGEWHTHAGIHRFQADVLKLLIQSTQPIALSMEQFSRDTQSIIDDYLQRSIGEQTLISQGNAWPNYESDYRPLVELAKHADMDVIAANAPKSIVRCIAKDGLKYLDVLPPEERAYVASEIDLGDSTYKEKFMTSMHHGEPSQHLNMYASQLTWDATMAESIVNYKHTHPNAKIVHIAGKFHTEGGLGIAAQIKQNDPTLNIIIVTPVGTITTDSHDYQLHVLTPPIRYIKPENQRIAFAQLFKNRKEPNCSNNE